MAKSTVIEKLEELVEKADALNLVVGRRFCALSDPELPTRKGVAFVKSQLDKLVRDEEDNDAEA